MNFRNIDDGIVDQLAKAETRVIKRFRKEIVNRDLVVASLADHLFTKHMEGKVFDLASLERQYPGLKKEGMFSEAVHILAAYTTSDRKIRELEDHNEFMGENVWMCDASLNEDEIESHFESEDDEEASEEGLEA